MEREEGNEEGEKKLKEEVMQVMPVQK